MWSQFTNVTDGQTDGQTDRQTTCDRNTALCTKVHRAVKTGCSVNRRMCSVVTSFSHHMSDILSTVNIIIQVSARCFDVVCGLLWTSESISWSDIALPQAQRPAGVGQGLVHRATDHRRRHLTRPSPLIYGQPASTPTRPTNTSSQSREFINTENNRQ